MNFHLVAFLCMKGVELIELHRENQRTTVCSNTYLLVKKMENRELSHEHSCVCECCKQWSKYDLVMCRRKSTTEYIVDVGAEH